jgi:hypothetical protein
VTSIRDRSFHLDSPGQSMSWKEFLMFCTLSVTSGVKFLSKNTLKYYLSSGGYLYFNLLLIFLLNTNASFVNYV